VTEPQRAAAQIPFAEVLLPWMLGAERRLRLSAPSVDGVLTPRALAGLVDGLGEELAFVAAPTLFDLFSQHPGRLWLSPRSRGAYLKFVHTLSQGRLQRVLAELPELSRLLDLVVGDWCERAARLVVRVENDMSALGDRFGLEIPVPRLSTIVGGTVEFAGRVVYKDRPLGMDAAWCELLRWVNARGLGLPLFVPEVVDRGGFGWMGFLPREPPSEPGDRRRYLERTGMMMCLAHLLGAGDLHADNVRPFGEHPVIVDGEVMIRPRRAGTDRGSASVLTTGWLPTPHHVEFSGMASEVFTRVPDWLFVGTDAMHPRPRVPRRAELRRMVQTSLLRDGVDGVEHLCTGFSEMYAMIAASGLPLDVFEMAHPRVLLRPTRWYDDAIARSVEPNHLLSAGRRGRVIGELVDEVPAALLDEPEVAESVRAAERSALTRLEFPRFSMPATGGQLSWRGRQLGSPFRETPLARAHRLLSEMSRAALDAQRRAITDSLTATMSSVEPAFVI
jgi:lantibiotic modifying enzyme